MSLLLLVVSALHILILVLLFVATLDKSWWTLPDKESLNLWYDCTWNTTTQTWDQDFKMASLVPLKEKKLMEVKLGELPSWIMMRDFTPSGIAGAFRRGYDRYYNKYINVRKGSISGISMVLAAYVVFSYCISYKELKHERRRKYH